MNTVRESFDILYGYLKIYWIHIELFLCKLKFLIKINNNIEN